MKKGLAIKIASGVLVVALVVVVALAIAGVFSAKNPTNNVVVNAEDASVSNVAVIRGIATDKVFYVASSKSITDISSYVSVRANGENVSLKLSDKKDENGNVGFTAKNGWAKGVAYRVSLTSGDIAFVEEQYKDMTSFIFIVEADDVIDCEVSDKVVELAAGAFTLDAIAWDNGVATKWTLTVNNVDAKYADDSVFVYEDKLDITKVDENGTLHSYALKLDANTPATYNASTKTYMATVEDANVDDVFDVLNVHTTVVPTADNFQFDEDATINSILNSEMFLSTVSYLYAEQLGNKSFDLGEYCKLSIDYNFNTNPVNVTCDITVTFSGFLKSAKGASVVIKIANVLTPEFNGNFQKSPLAFDASLDLNVDTTVTVSAGFDYNFNNVDDENNTEANTALKNVVNKVAAIVSDTLNTKNETEKSFIFATWVIPVGTTPIQIVESMGIEVKADLHAKLGASLKNNFNVELGVVYCDGEVSPIANVKDDFKIGMITLWGAVESKVGLYNEIGITACGIISVNLDLSVGVYCDLAGRLEMDGWEIMNGNFGIDPAYYVETGIYLDMDISGKVLTFNIKKQNLLSKKWPLWTAGYKYIPQVDETTEENKALTAVEDVYLNTGYFFLTTFKAYAIDIQNINDGGSVKDIDWDEFNYEYDSAYLTMVDNKVRVAATAPVKFDTDIVVTSKVNKGWKKIVRVHKTPEGADASIVEKSYVKGSNSELKYAVRLNSAKFMGLTIDGYDDLTDYYTYEDEILVLKPELLESLDYGMNTVLFESSKNYLQLYVNVSSDKDIVPANGFAAASFDKAEPVNASFAIDLLGYEITAISGLDATEWVYSASTDTLKVLASALLDEEVGTVAYGIEFSNGETAQLKVNVQDSRLAILNTNAYEYKLESGADLALDITLYDNSIDYLEIGGKNVTSYLNGSAIDASFFDNYSSAQTLKNCVLQAGDSSYKFSIQLVTSDAVILPVKYVEFDKNSAKDVTLLASIPADVTLACDNLTSGKTLGANFVQDEDSISISAAYLKTLANGKYTFKLIGGENEPEFIVKVADSTTPWVDATAISLKKGVDSSKKIAWTLGQYAKDDFVVEGLKSNQYVASDDGLTLIVDALAYGETTFNVITPENSFAIKVSVDGSARFVQTDYVVRVNAGDELIVKTDLAGKKLYDIKFVKDGKEAAIYNTQFRNNEGNITISNDFVYNLEAGAYDITVVLNDGTSITGAKLTVKGELTSFNQVENCDGKSEDTAYKIYTKAQFLAIVKDTNKLLSADSFNGVYFKLMADIDLEYATIDPIGKKSAPFKGVFDGNGYTISNFTISDVNNEYTGLFAFNAGIIKNVRLVNATVDVSKAGSVGIGIVAGCNSGLIKNVQVIGGKINAVSKSWMDIRNAYFDIGGIVGYNDNAGLASLGVKRSIENCVVEVEINAEVKGLSVAGINLGGRKSCINVGAVVGYFASGSIYKVNVSADIDAKAHNDNVNANGWYGNTELEDKEVADSAMRVYVR